MALANVAFLAALNNKRVLIMDWDLEAPGLHYYFRGMLDSLDTRTVRNSPGVLNLVWDWSNTLRRAETNDHIDALLERYRSGLAFEEVVHSLLPDPNHFEEPSALKGGVLHHIGAGSPVIEASERMAYEEALARFDWASFFAEEAGGTLLEALRSWAQANYDYIFIDSRTGFADVAGICTMQIPDQVALCYIYNRQNIDGIAQVADAIRIKRPDIALRAVPMRVARENTSEEADARARARRELMRRGGFSGDAVETDQKLLAIHQASNVPFYETIALIVSERMRSDVLALDYLNLANQLLGQELTFPELPLEWVSGVRRRLQPRQAGPDYLLGLRDKDAERAVEEVTQLLEGALEERVDGGVEPDYVSSLVATATHLARNSEEPFDVVPMIEMALNLLRDLDADNAGRWHGELGDLLGFYLEHFSLYLEDDEELLLLDEADSVYAAHSGDDAKLRRLGTRRRAMRLQLTEQNIEAAQQISSEITRLISELSHLRAQSEPPVDLLVAELDAALLRGDMNVLLEKPDTARRSYEQGFKILGDKEIGARTELVRLRFDLHLRLARLSSLEPLEAAKHAIAALDWTGGLNGYIVQFVSLGEVVVATNDATMLAEFLRKGMTGPDRRQNQFVTFYGRSPRNSSLFLEFARQALAVLDGSSPQIIDATLNLVMLTLEIIERLSRTPIRRSMTDLKRELELVGEAVKAHPELPRDMTDRFEYLRLRAGTVHRFRPSE